MDYLSRNPVSPPQTNDAYDEEDVINNILLHYSFISKHGCLNNHIKQIECGTEKSERKTKYRPRTNDARQQTATDCLYSDTHKRSNSNNLNNAKRTIITMEARMVDKMEASNTSAEVTELITLLRERVKPEFTA